MDEIKKGKISTTIRIIVWLILIIGGVIGGIIIDLRYFRDFLFSLPFHIISFIIGLIVLKLSFNAASKGGKELAKSGRVGNIPRLQINKLVTTGIYSKMRHPMLFGLMLLPLSIALIIGSVSFILIIAPIEMIFIAFMVLTLEEMECQAKFGKEYQEYAKRVPAVCLKLDCLRELFLER